MNTSNWDDSLVNPNLKEPDIPQKPKPGSVGELLANATSEEAKVIKTLIARVEIQNKLEISVDNIKILSEINKQMIEFLPLLKLQVNHINTIKFELASFDLESTNGESLEDVMNNLNLYFNDIVEQFETGNGITCETNFVPNKNSIDFYKTKIIILKELYSSFMDLYSNALTASKDKDKQGWANTASPQDILINNCFNKLCKYVDHLFYLSSYSFGAR